MRAAHRGVTLDKHSKGCRRWAEQARSRSRRPSRRGPEMSRSAEAKVAHLKRGVAAAGPGDGDCESWRECSGHRHGGGLRVNNRMQATAGPLVVTARAVRRRA